MLFATTSPNYKALNCIEKGAGNGAALVSGVEIERPPIKYNYFESYRLDGNKVITAYQTEIIDGQPVEIPVYTDVESELERNQVCDNEGAELLPEINHGEDGSLMDGNIVTIPKGWLNVGINVLRETTQDAEIQINNKNYLAGSGCLYATDFPQFCTANGINIGQEINIRVCENFFAEIQVQRCFEIEQDPIEVPPSNPSISTYAMWDKIAGEYVMMEFCKTAEGTIIRNMKTDTIVDQETFETDYCPFEPVE